MLRLDGGNSFAAQFKGPSALQRQCAALPLHNGSHNVETSRLWSGLEAKWQRFVDLRASVAKELAHGFRHSHTSPPQKRRRTDPGGSPRLQASIEMSQQAASHPEGEHPEATPKEDPPIPNHGTEVAGVKASEPCTIASPKRSASLTFCRQNRNNKSSGLNVPDQGAAGRFCQDIAEDNS